MLDRRKEYARLALSSKGFDHIRVQLEQKYELENLDHLSYALAVNIAVLPARESRKVACLLADHNCLGREYASANDFTFFPLAFHPAYGNFSSAEPHAFLSENLLAIMKDIMKDIMSYLNEGANVVSFTTSRHTPTSSD